MSNLSSTCRCFHPMWKFQDFLPIRFYMKMILVIGTKVSSLFRGCKQIAGCFEFCTEIGLHSLVSVRNSEHPAICLQSLKRERTLGTLWTQILKRFQTFSHRTLGPLWTQLLKNIPNFIPLGH